MHPIKSGINASWYPLIVHEVFPDLDKIIFLGADTVFNLDVGELWAYDLGGYGLGAAVDIKSPNANAPLCVKGFVDHNNWFNVDVLLIKPKFFAENIKALIDACKFVYEQKCYFYENDALNYLFSENYLKLPYRFNSIVGDIRRIDPKPYRIEKVIYHFAGAKPDLNTDDVFNKLYLEYFMKTPWATIDVFGNIHKALNKTLRKFNNEAKGALLHLTNLLTTRRRAFLIEDNFLEQAKKIFEIKQDEFVMTSSEGIDKFVKKLTAAKGKKIFYVLISNPFQYLQLKNFLLSRNFIEGTDFVNGTLFLSENQGMNFNFDTGVILQEM